MLAMHRYEVLDRDQQIEREGRSDRAERRLTRVKPIPNAATYAASTGVRTDPGYPSRLEQPMANISRIEPQSRLSLFDPFRDLEDLLGSRRMRSLFRDVADEPSMKMDVREDEGVYRVKAEMPGVRKEDIHVAIDGNVVSISGEVQRETEEKKGEAVLCSERYYGRQSRSFTLRHDIDQGKAEAKYQDGVLELVLPKRAGNEARQLIIK